jgi:hypothetical protein
LRPVLRIAARKEFQREVRVGPVVHQPGDRLIVFVSSNCGAGRESNFESDFETVPVSS